MALIESDLDVNGDIAIDGHLDFGSGTAKTIKLGSQRAYTLPAQGTRMRVLTLADHTYCRVFLESTENSRSQPIVLDIHHRAQGDEKPKIIRAENYEWHAHSNDIRFTSDSSGGAGGATHIYFEKVAFSTGRTVNIRKVETFDGTCTILDGSTTNTGGGAEEAIGGNFSSLQTAGDITVGDDLFVADGGIIKLGTGSDLKMYHDGSSSYIENGTGNLFIMARATDADISFQSDNGSGGDVEYFRLDGGLSCTFVSRRFVFSDSTQLQFGNQSDTQIYNDGSNFYIDNITGDQDIIFKGTDGSADITALTLDMSDAGTAIFNHDIKIADDGIVKIGNSTDLFLSHDATNSHIANATGDLKITQNANDKDIIFNCDDGSGGNTAYLTLDGSATTVEVHKAMTLNSVNLTVTGDNKIDFQGTAGGGGDGILYKDSGGGARYAMMFPGSDVVAINNRAANGVVQIMANTSTAGSGGEVVTAEFQDDLIDFKVNSKRTHSITSTTHGDANGDVVYFGSTTSMTVGKIYYYNASGNWALTDADAVASADGMIGVALGAASNTNGVLLKGMVTLDHDPGTVGDPIYLSGTAGQATSTAPSGNGDIVRVVGYCVGSTNGEIYFNPSGTFVEVSA